jgi:hypothetical protein
VNLKGRPERASADTVQLELQKIRLEDVDWILLTQGRFKLWAFVNTIMNLLVLTRLRIFYCSTELISRKK